MSNIIKPGQRVLYMKVGVHAQEPLEKIIKRKLQEIEDEGYAMWGYGGSTCWPSTMVQPFAEEGAKEGQKIYLCMKEMNSRHFAEDLRASQSSVNGKSGWTDIPEGINVLGSRFALTIKNLRRDDFTLPLSRTTVAVGNSLGAVGSKYITGQADKACLQLAPNVDMVPENDERVERISLVAELCPPYAVFLR